MAESVLQELSMTEVQQSEFQHSPPRSVRRQSSASPLASPLDLTDDELTIPSGHGRRTSTRSSISSLPASVVHPLDDGSEPPRPRYTHPAPTHSSEGYARNVSQLLERRLGSAFRQPSSVEEMQMKDDDSESVLIHRRRKDSRISARSHGRVHSPLSSVSKRQSYSSQSSPLKGSKLRKEFPLVLLHCSILPPASASIPHDYDSDLYAALLPEEYRARWNTLQDRLADPEMKSRGILISHPQEDYELLEERLLESLGLEVPRLQGSHFFHDDRSVGDSGIESGSQVGDDSSDDALQDGRCPDCGKCLHPRLENERKWEIKVFAANGLMRAGAWAAAWRDMEKVDVEISLAMPEDVRRELNSRLEVLRSVQESEGETTTNQGPHPDLQEKERSYPRPESRTEYDGSYHHAMPPAPGRCEAPSISQQFWQHTELFCDRKNILIVLLSLLLLFYVIAGSYGGVPFQAATQIATSTAQERKAITGSDAGRSFQVQIPIPEAPSAAQDTDAITTTIQTSRARETEVSISANTLSSTGMPTTDKAAVEGPGTLSSTAAPMDGSDQEDNKVTIDAQAEPLVIQQLLSQESICQVSTNGEDGEGMLGRSC